MKSTKGFILIEVLISLLMLSMMIYLLKILLQA
ncbi:MAG: hypothetical protein GX845_01650 [Erysipelothrix sp.]|jgi:type II secretory pathway pseudopilin PulG|nr:hypothetical protein [Erysipelothrix sp.]